MGCGEAAGLQSAGGNGYSVGVPLNASACQVMPEQAAAPLKRAGARRLQAWWTLRSGCRTASACCASSARRSRWPTCWRSRASGAPAWDPGAALATQMPRRLLRDMQQSLRDAGVTNQ